MTTPDRKYFWREGDPLWYKDATIYELHVRAFHDSNGDGMGDFAGLTQKLDYLQDLGIDTIWLLPFYPSPLKDDGYDIASYTDVHPAYGTLADFKDFIREANYRGLRVITELILNHTSDQHPWFQRARRAAAGSQWRNFYVWSDTPDKYRETRIIFKDFEPSNWTWDPVARAYYWHRFYSHQPDLNYDSPRVQQAVKRVMDFWLGMGVSGLRLDAVPYLYERDGTNCENLPETHRFLKELRRHVDETFRNRMLLGEANQWSEDAVAYFGQGDECHMAYHFPLMPRMFMAIRMEDRFPIVDILQSTPRIPDASQWALFLRNHDELTLEMVTDEERDYMYRVYAYDTQARINLGIRRRLAPLLNNNRRKIELMNSLLFSLPGTPIIYYGDEIGMGDNFFLGDRNGVRTPMQWSADRNAGFSTASPQRLYLPVIIEPEYHYEAINVDTQQSNPDSLLWWTKHLISTRKRFKALGRGTLEFLQPDNRKVLAFVRRYEKEAVLVVANLSNRAQYCSLNLAALTGMTPVEAFGQTQFPRIGEALYSFTLGPHACYWFSLEAKELLLIGEQRPPASVPIPTISLAGDWENLYLRPLKADLEAALLNYIKQCRWFGGKARQSRSAEIHDIVPMPFGASVAHFLLVRIEYTEGEPEIYQVPVTYALEERANHVIERTPQACIARLKLSDENAGKEGIVYEAVFDQDFRDTLLRVAARRHRFAGENGEIITSHTEVFRQLRGDDTEMLQSTLLTGEQTNTSIVYGSRLQLKLFRRLEEGISLELELGRFLTEEEHFPNTPPLAGAFEYWNHQRSEPMTLAVLQGYVPNEGDLWHYTLDHLGRFFEQVLARPGATAPVAAGKSLLDIVNENVPPVMQETIGPYLVSAQLLGQRTAELHLTLASAVDEPNLVPEPFSTLYQRSLYHGMRGFALQVLQLLRQRLGQLSPGVKATAQQVLNKEPSIMATFRNITKQKITGMRIRCHGDYHLGQVLWTETDLVIIDFEGEPARPLGERRIKRSPLKDVAGMIRSFHYAAHTALREKTSTVLRPEDLPGLEDWACAWALWVSKVFLKSYLELTARTPILPQSQEEMRAILDAYILDKAIYEVNYELNNRPDWLGIPLHGILQMC